MSSNYARRLGALTLGLATLLAAGAPTDAFAKEVAIAPFIAKGGLDPLIALNITSLVASELDFASEYEGATQLDSKPAGLTVACLSQSACLKKIGNGTGLEHLVAGSVAPAGDEYEIYMVLYNTSGGSYVRKKSFKVETTPEKMADSMGGFVNELLTGKSVAAVAAADTVSDDFSMDDDFDDFEFDDGDDFGNTTIALGGNSNNTLDDFEDEPDDWEVEEERRREDERRAAAEDQRRRDEAEAERRQAEDDRRREEDRRRAEAEEREREEAEARRRAEDEERRQAEADRRRLEEERDRAEADRRRAEEDERRRLEDERARADADRYEEPEDDFDDIVFGDASDDIEVEIDDITFGDATADIVSDYSSSDSSYSDDDYGYREYDSYDRETRSSDDDYDSRNSSSRDYDLDEPDERDSRSSRSSRSSSSRDSRDSRSSSSRSSSSRSSSSGVDARIDTNSNDPKIGLSLRAGYSKFQVFKFATYGAELSIPIADAAFVNVGLEGYSTQRDIPEALREEYGGAETRWNHIMPFNLGITYQPTKRNLRPYIGGDLTLTPYTSTFKTAPGLRVRAGADIMVTDQFGLNVNGGAGFWYGKDFDTVQADVEPFGGTGLISAGTVILF
ncbi:MAG: hypothetical protein GY913_29430 [Proteobacteria bacterium]|nr:hypothetical protein [Pseudomonadota bacterium]MCP4921038.1 hypothetical protein [Pseudomonadota bacterium]